MLGVILFCERMMIEDDTFLTLKSFGLSVLKPRMIYISVKIEEDNSMNIFIAGATGRVAQHLIDYLIEDGHNIIAGSRHPENIQKHEQVTAVRLDLHDDVETLAKIIGKVDVIYFTAGSRGKDLLQTDAYGAVKIMQAAEINNIQRFIMLSSIFSLEPDKWKLEGLDSLTNYNIAKFFADSYLMNNTNLSYTILQPTSLVETPGSHKITIDSGQLSENSIENVAETLANILKFDNTIHKIIKMRDGDTPIEQALEQVD